MKKLSSNAGKSNLLSLVLILALYVAISPVGVFAQSTPAAAKAKTTAKPTTTSASKSTTAAKPAARTTTGTTTTGGQSASKAKTSTTSKAVAQPSTNTSTVKSGQVVSTPTAPANSSNSVNGDNQNINKTAAAPVGDFKAVQNTKATAAPANTVATKKTKNNGFGFKEGDKLLNVGLGLSSYYYGNPIGISFESGIHPDISVGGQFDYNAGRYDDGYYSSSRWGYKAYYIGARGSYHFNRILNINSDKVDLYAGVGLGYQSFRWNDRSYGYGYNYGSGLFYNYFIGGKYYFSSKTAAFVELGYSGLSSTRIGISFKF